MFATKGDTQAEQGILACLGRVGPCQNEKPSSSFIWHLQQQDQKILPFGDVLQHSLQVCIYSRPPRAGARSCPCPFFLFFHRKRAERTQGWSQSAFLWWSKHTSRVRAGSEHSMLKMSFLPLASPALALSLGIGAGITNSISVEEAMISWKNPQDYEKE